MSKNDFKSCQCKKCKNACTYAPGFMTPNEAELAINSGYAGQLMIDWWVMDVGTKDIELLCPAVIGHEGRYAPELNFFSVSKGVCTFFVDGKCKIHDSGFKPLECCRAMACEESYMDRERGIVKLWDTPKGKKILKRFKEFQL